MSREAIDIERDPRSEWEPHFHAGGDMPCYGECFADTSLPYMERTEKP